MVKSFKEFESTFSTVAMGNNNAVNHPCSTGRNVIILEEPCPRHYGKMPVYNHNVHIPRQIMTVLRSLSAGAEMIFTGGKINTAARQNVQSIDFA